MEQSGIDVDVFSALVHASIGGALFVAVLVGVFRLIPRLPASLRFSMYLLACVRMLAGLVIVIPVPVRLSDSPWTRVLATAAPHQRNYREVTAAGAASAAGNLALPAVATVAHAAVQNAGRGFPDDNGSRVAPVSVRMPAISPTAAAVGVWLGGAVLVLIGLLRDAFAVRRIVWRAAPLPHSDVYDDLVPALKIRGLPALLASPDITSPMVSGIFRPTVIVPDGFHETLTIADQRLAIAHELAHIRRGDLVLNLLLSLTRALFFFHPLAHLAVRECAAAREECCDGLAVRATGATPAQYGRFLISFVAAHRDAAAYVRADPASAIGMAAASFRPLRRRLAALGAGSRQTPTAITGAMILGAWAGTLPIRLVGAPAAVRAPGEPDLPHYQLVDLGTLGGQSSDATAVTDRGLIVGGSNFNRHAIWGHPYTVAGAGATMHDLADLIAGRRGLARAANDSGEVVVESFARAGRPSALVVAPDGRSTAALGSLPDFPYTRPLAIDDRGDVVGAGVSAHAAPRGGLATHAFLWREGDLRDIGTLGGAYSVAYGVNRNGLIVGKSDIAPDHLGRSATHAFYSDNGATPRDLGVLPGGAGSVANGVDSQGRIVGTSDVADGTRHAFLATASGPMRDLGALADYPGSHALSINDRGLIVGTAYSGDESAAADDRAVLWQLPSSTQAAPRIVDLNDRIPAGTGWTLEVARSINSRGQIVGQGLVNGRKRAFLLNPLPSEP